ncbi:MAG TPA: hypothetical protein VKT49_23885 [Bryobacteraceae bacterium]|nr:hypothetical protein [Bryobacteraceae bacterium]
MIRLAWITLCIIAPAARPEEPPTPAALEESGLRELRNVRRVYVDRLTGGETAAQMRDILISSLEAARIFKVTENEERADAILRGAAEDLVFTDVHSSSDSLDARANFGSGRSSSSSRSSYGGVGIGQNESERAAERRHEAIASVRLVSKDGDVIWSTTQESLGAKFRGASADVADKIAGKLKEDFEKARKLK